MPHDSFVIFIISYSSLWCFCKNTKHILGDFRSGT